MKEQAPFRQKVVQNCLADTSYNCQLSIDHRNGLIFDSSVAPISGKAMFPLDNARSFSILIVDESSNEVARLKLRPEKYGSYFKSSFSWDLKSSFDSYVNSGRYTINLIEVSNGDEVARCSVACMVADTRVILSTTALLKSSKRLRDPTSKQVLSIYADIIRDIEIRIIEGLRDHRFDEPYFVARTTAGFVRQIYNDVENDSASQFRSLISMFASKNPGLRLRENGKLGLGALFDFLVNYMADPEDQARATAMVKCEYRNFTANDRDVILSALVSGILPHCMNLAPSRNVITRRTYALVERLLKVGIRYVCAKHIDNSIAICKATLV